MPPTEEAGLLTTLTIPQPKEMVAYGLYGPAQAKQIMKEEGRPWFRPPLEAQRVHHHRALPPPPSQRRSPRPPPILGWSPLPGGPPPPASCSLRGYSCI